MLGIHCLVPAGLFLPCGALWFSDSVHNLQVRDCRFKSLAGLNLLWRCGPRQGLYPHMHPLDPGVSRYLVEQGRLVCLSSFCVPEMAAWLYAPHRIEMAYEWTGPMTRGWLCENRVSYTLRETPDYKLARSPLLSEWRTTCICTVCLMVMMVIRCPSLLPRECQLSCCWVSWLADSMIMK